MKLDNTLKWVIPSLIVIGLLLWMLLPWQCSQAQTVGRADTLSLSIDYTAQTDVVMTEVYGQQWKLMIREDWRKSWRNWLSQGRERFKEGRSRLYDESMDVYLTDPERRQRDRLYDSALVRQRREVVRQAEAVEPSIVK